MNRLIITGTGRSGTGYMAELLNSLGVNCGHERVYRAGWPVRWGDYQAESSWLAAPIKTKVPKVLVLRDPLSFVSSYSALQSSPEDAPYQAYREKYAPSAYLEKMKHDQLLSFWVHWNIIACADACQVYWLDRLSAESVASISSLVTDVSPQEAKAAMGGLPKDVNNKSHAKLTTELYSWEDFRPGLAELAQDLYGMWREKY